MSQKTKPNPIVDDEVTEPIVLPASTASAITETVCLFIVDGREIHVPAQPRAAVAIRYLRNLKRKGTDYAAAAMLEELLGPDGLDALADYDDLTRDQMKQIMAAAQKLVMGSMEDEAENSGGPAR